MLIFLLCLIVTVYSSNIRQIEEIEPNYNLRLLDATNSTNVTYIYRQCQHDTDCLYGTCNTQTGVCACYPGYITLWTNGNQTQQGNTTIIDYSLSPLCNYKLKSQLTALMLSMFVGFGAEHFYMERLDSGISKFFFYIGCCLTNIIFFVIYKCFPSKRKYIEFLGTFETLYLGCGIFFILLWNIYDWVNIGFNSLPDGHNMPLLSWNTR
jgi:hypothetical protein